jgi:hypothetical protein
MRLFLATNERRRALRAKRLRSPLPGGSPARMRQDANTRTPRVGARAKTLSDGMTATILRLAAFRVLFMVISRF